MGFASLSFGATVGKVSNQEGMVALFTDDQWECPPGIYKIEIFDALGTKVREGCWKGVGDTVQIIFSDGGRFVIYANEVTWNPK
jgi:hypothetical protein